jgi:hypothetical protein
MPSPDVHSCTDETPAAAKLSGWKLRLPTDPGSHSIPNAFSGPPIRLLLSFLFCMVCTNSFAEPYTPAVGSPERVAIANAVRASVAQLGGQFEEDARRGAKFVIAVLKINFELACRRISR